MRIKFRRFIITAIAIISIVAGFSVAAKKDKYIGTEQCLVCHNETHAAIIKAYNKTPHRSAMVDARKKPNAIIAKFDANSPIKKTDIRYVLGIGKSYQNYLDKDLRVLPAKWDVNKQAWVPQEAVDGATQCVGCHVTNFDPAGRTWTELGVGCESCHGPGADHAESMEAKDIQGLKKMDGKKLDMVCGQCHSVGTDPSGKYAFPISFTPGDDLSKSFNLKTVNDSGITNSEYNDFLSSKHAQGGMNCTTCHDAHGDKAKAVHQLRQPINDQCMACHSPTIESLKKHAPDAPVDTTCAACHMLNNSHRFEKGKSKS